MYLSDSCLGLQCSPALLSGRVGDSVASSCTMENVDVVSNMIISQNGAGVFTRENATGIEGVIQITSDVSVDINAASGTMNFVLSLTCLLEGSFTIEINNGTQDVVQVGITGSLRCNYTH